MFGGGCEKNNNHKKHGRFNLRQVVEMENEIDINKMLWVFQDFSNKCLLQARQEAIMVTVIHSEYDFNESFGCLALITLD